MGLPMYEQRLDEIVRETCCNCGVVFGVTKFLQDMKVRDKAVFYCPNGYGQSYTSNEADRLRKELERTSAQLEQANRAKQIAQDTARMLIKTPAWLINYRHPDYDAIGMLRQKPCAPSSGEK